MSDKRTRCWDVDLCCGDDLCRFQNGESMPRGVYCAKDDTAPPPAPADDASGDDGTCIDGHPHRCGRCDRDIVERRADDASGAEAGEDVVVYRGPDGGDFGTSREGPEDEAWVAVPAARRDRERAEAKTLRRLLGRAVKLLEDEGFTVFPDEVRAALAVFRTGGERPASGQGG